MIKPLTLALCLFTVAGLAQTPGSESAVALIKELRKIHTPNGIEVLEPVDINGDKQWISIRGKDKANPVLLFIHGGPASPVMPVSWAFQNTWEDYFTVVQWDQRAAGKNWLTTDTTAVKEHLKAEQIVQDGVAMVNYLCGRMQKEKIIIMGYSFGARVGIQLAALIPDKIHAYVGVGQTSPGDPEAYLYKKLMAYAESEKNQKAIDELKAIAPYPRPNGPVANILVTRKWARYYNGGWYGKKDLSLYFDLPMLATEYTPDEVTSMNKSTPWLTRRMMRSGPTTTYETNFKVPVIFMMGVNDLHTPYEPSRKYFGSITSPGKKFISFEYSCHFPFMEEPGRFLVTLVSEVLPLAR
ncbi:MAG TPA: alpha/beta hydrolase [Cyclobacteriaceae bacterium]|nr:alpha/beta hydrolase [Cyclobacteriaceae bacterium]